jgi:formylglycine-generating enzyme required for sulfatase activity
VKIRVLLLIMGLANIAAAEPSAVWRDCTDCPEMVSLQAGQFLMGSHVTEDEHKVEEEPQRKVKIAAFAMGRYEVTYAEFDVCVNDGACPRSPSDQKQGRGRKPVTDVSWNDAQYYVKWLSKKTGKTYRLPSEAEWEYAARAGTKTPYFWGKDPSKISHYAHHTADPDASVPVGQFKANPFGLYDVYGNVAEWVEDCWNAKNGYQGAPNDGSPRGGSDADCFSRVLRGGSWDWPTEMYRSAFRGHFHLTARTSRFGFRVARKLP